MRLEQSHGRLMQRLKDRAKKSGTSEFPEFGEVELDEAIQDRVRARMSAEALRSNYAAIQAQVPGQALLPMIKANGYGHGASWAARVLLSLPGLYGLGVATFAEALELRKVLGPRHRKLRLVVFSGAAPWSEQKGQLCEHNGLVPVIADDSDWQAFFKGGWPARLSYELKFNTGMNRLGLSLNSAPSVAKALRNKPVDWHPDGIFSHLASGEAPDAKLARTQLERFIWLRKELGPALPSSLFHLANSAGIWNSKLFGLRDLTDVVRPGLSLYGIPPWKDAPVRGLVPVMTVEAPVLHVHQLKPGETVGYGGTYTVETSKGGRIAILAAGYADGIHRALSNGGLVHVHGQLMRMAGNISMDLSAAICPEGTRRGEWAQLLGPEIGAWAQAALAQTIPYELLTSISPRVRKVYDSKDL